MTAEGILTMSNDILGYVVQKTISSPSGISMMIDYMKYSKEEDGYCIYTSCPPEMKAGVFAELEDNNLANIFAKRVLNTLMSIGLPIENCRRIYCEEMWLKLTPMAAT